MENKIHDAFEQVRASDELKRSTLQYLHAQRERRTPHGNPWVRSLAALCAVLTLAVLGGGWWAVRTPVSYVSIDVTPSVELTLNRFDRVISATAYNGDGASVLNGVSLQWLSCAEAIDVLLESSAMVPYLTEASALTVTVASSDDAREAGLLAGINSSACYRRHSGQCYSANVESLTEAHSHGMSLGKYAAWQVLSQYDGTVTEEDCRDMTMAEIYTRIHACENGDSYPDGGCEDPVDPVDTVDPVPQNTVSPSPAWGDGHHSSGGNGNGSGHHSEHGTGHNGY